MKKIVSAVLLVLLISSGAWAQAAYDSAKVKAAMQANSAALGTIKKAIDASDTLATADAFWTIVQANRPMLGYSPPKGDKASWDKAFNEMIASALKGMGAAGSKDWDKAKAALAELRADMSSGHGAFR